MDRVVDLAQIEQEIEALVRDQGVDPAEAAAIVGLRHGELLGDGDLLCIHPLTEEQRRRYGRTLHEVMAELGELDELSTDEQLPKLDR
jgi:hypothetical protein